MEMDLPNNDIDHKTTFENSITKLMDILQEQPELYNFVKDFTGKSFGFCTDEEIYTIFDELNESHTICSFGTCLRECQRRLKANANGD